MYDVTVTFGSQRKVDFMTDSVETAFDYLRLLKDVSGILIKPHEEKFGEKEKKTVKNSFS